MNLFLFCGKASESLAHVLSGWSALARNGHIASFKVLFFEMLADSGRDPFNQNSNRSDREKRTTSKSGPVFSKLFRLDRTDPLSFGPKFPEILVEWIAPSVPPWYSRVDPRPLYEPQRQRRSGMY